MLRGAVGPAYAIGRERYCFHYLGIASAAAEISRNRLDNVVSRRVRIVSEQCVRH
jgi:hypothetical protein